MTLTLQSGTPGENGDSLSVPRCEAISKAWQAVAFLEEVRAELKQVRQSAARDAADGAFGEAISHLIVGATLLVPSGIADQVPQLETRVHRDVAAP